ncbi:hypothetical protein FQA39_LY00333 [Lamprigera yunnana]|nr:hypothetical protein FQA39_LY00333 [Lamprigera yunnana]
MSQVGSETWSVVKFPEENSVTAVPTSWLHGSICFWPPFSRKIVQAAIERGDPPNINTWQQFDYLALRNNVFDSFKEAERKSRKALETLDLESQTEDNDESIGKRKRRVPKHFDDDHSCSSEDENTRSDLPKPPKPPAMFKKRTTIQKPVGNIKIVQSHSQQISNTFDNVNIAGTSTFLNHEDISIQQSPTTSNRELSTPQNSRRPHVEKHNCGDIGGYLKQILRKQNILQCMVTDMNTKLIEIENFVKTTPSHATEAVEVESIFVKVQNLPVDSDDALQELENFLADHNEFNEAVKKIMKLGGNSTYEFIFRAAKKLITVRFAGAEFSFLGRKQKRKFIDLKLAQLLKKEENHTAEDHGQKEDNEGKLDTANERSPRICSSEKQSKEITNSKAKN